MRITGLMLLGCIMISPLNTVKTQGLLDTGIHYSGKWKTDENGWWFDNEDGTYAKGERKEIEGQTYYFNNSGYMVTGWVYLDGQWYFFNSSGAMKKKAWEGNYWLGEDGVMAVSAWVDNNQYYVGANGAWIENYGKPKWVQDSVGWWYDNGDGTYPKKEYKTIGTTEYYFNEKGYMAVGWTKIEDKWYYFDSDGIKQKSRWIGDYYLKENGEMAVSEWVGSYYVGKDGKWIEDYGKPKWMKDSIGWWYDNGDGSYPVNEKKKIDGAVYLFDEKGYMKTGWHKDGDDWYYFTESGAMKTGWMYYGDHKFYYFDTDGRMQTGWVLDKGKYYYLDDKGAMKTGWLKEDDKWYYLDPTDGFMRTGWVRENWCWYYMDKNGVMLTGDQTIDGVKYHLNEETGVWDDPEGDPKFYNPDSILIIANKQHKLPDGYEPYDLVIPNVRKTGANPYLRSEAASALENMFNAAAGEGVYLVLGSGYRSQSTQSAIYYNYVARDGQAAADRYSARPGYSEHQTGLAVDISDYYGNYYLSESFAYTAEANWLYSNAYKYGFIMRYPQGKEYITGYMYEPWHFRYVGVSNAYAIYNSGLTVEEYYGIPGGDY